MPARAMVKRAPGRGLRRRRRKTASRAFAWCFLPALGLAARTFFGLRSAVFWPAAFNVRTLPQAVSRLGILALLIAAVSAAGSGRFVLIAGWEGEFESAGVRVSGVERASDRQVAVG